MRRALVLGLMLAHTLLLPACSRELGECDPFAQPDLSGSVRIPLAGVVAGGGADGTTYLLRDATVEISGSAMLTLSTRSDADLSAHKDALTSPLPAGSYTLFLRPGFQLIEVDPSGVERAVDAALAGQNPQHFTVRELEDATLKLSFAASGGPTDRSVVFGAREAVRVTGVY